MRKPRLLDLFCCQGGASEGYRRAGFDVYGVDIDPQPRYPFPFHQGDALRVLRRLLVGESVRFGISSEWTRGQEVTLSLADFAAVHASPPCQAHTKAWKLRKNEHPKLIEPTRHHLMLLDPAMPWVIENVEEAAPELVTPVMLCGESFGLETYRHRLFESNVALVALEHRQHVARTTKMGRPPVPGEYMHIVGNFSGVDRAREVMGMPWASRDGLREAIPPAYTEHIGHQLMARIKETANAFSV